MPLLADMISSNKIYLITPPNFELDSFVQQVEEALSSRKIDLFQLRMKSVKENEIVRAFEKFKPIAQKYRVPLILNDNVELANKLGADGVHIGGEDGKVKETRNIIGGSKILGVSCYDSRQAAISAKLSGADYVSFGAFFESSTKQSQGKPNLNILNWWKENHYNDNKKNIIPAIAIGGINDKNCGSLIYAGADSLAIISYVWNHNSGVKFAIDQLTNQINNCEKST